MLLINPATEKIWRIPLTICPLSASRSPLVAYLPISRNTGYAAGFWTREIVDITPSVLREALGGFERPYIIGIHCLTAHVGRGYQLAHLIKTEYPDSVVILGGLHPSVLPEEPFETGCVDYVVRGEGRGNPVAVVPGYPVETATPRKFWVSRTCAITSASIIRMRRLSQTSMKFPCFHTICSSIPSTTWDS